MSDGVTSAGFIRTRLDVLLQQLQDRLHSPDVLGVDAVLDGTTSDGQIAGIIAEIEDLLLQFGEDAYNVADPNNAIGAALYRLGTLCGITFQTGNYGRVICGVCVRAGETLAAGSKLRDKTTGVEYATVTPVGPSPADDYVHTVHAQALKYDTLPALTTHEAEPVVPMYEWLSVVFLADGSAGTAPESPAKFRQRRARSTAKPSQGMIDSLYGALADLPGIGDVRVFNNPTSAWRDIKPGDGAIPGHSAIVVARNAVVVDAVDMIARTMWLYMGFADFYAAGTGATVTEIVDSQGAAHKYGYYLSTPYVIDVEITYKPIPGEGFGGQEDIDTLKAALVAWADETLMPGDDLKMGFLYPVALGDVVASLGPGAPRGKSGGYAIEIEQIRLAHHGEALAVQNVVVPFNQHASLSRANITLVEAT